MIRLAISAEGRTEMEFVKFVLADHLRQFGVEPSAVNLRGNVSVERIVSEMARLSWNFEAVTSLVDFYGFIRKGERSVEELEKNIAQEIEKRIPNSSRVFPYVQKHEFESLLFSDVAAFEAITLATKQDVNALSKIRQQFPTPEDINDSNDTAPNKRIAHVLPGYKKPTHGHLVAEEIGLENIRAECPRFHAWLTCLEGLARPT